MTRDPREGHAHFADDEACELELRRSIRLLAERIPVPAAPRAWPRPKRRGSIGSSLRALFRSGREHHATVTTGGGASAAVPATAARVLIVEDDTATRQVIAEALSDEGFTVVAAHDGAHALRLAAASHPDLILLDVGLPVIDGPGFAARWRQRPDSAGVPIVVISGRPDGREAAKAMAAAAFFGKPLDLGVLSNAVRSLAHEGPHPRAA